MTDQRLDITRLGGDAFALQPPGAYLGDDGARLRYHVGCHLIGAGTELIQLERFGSGNDRLVNRRNQPAQAERWGNLLHGGKPVVVKGSDETVFVQAMGSDELIRGGGQLGSVAL